MRCEHCLLPQSHCLCHLIHQAPARSQFCLLMYDTEPMKPSNTGRLIADVLPHTQAFQWSRTAVDPELLTLLNDPTCQPYIIFPASYAEPERVVKQLPPPEQTAGKRPLFVMLDGTWTEARKMFRKSPYLDALPVISVDLSRVSAYRLREAHADGQYCTAEVAIALLDLAGDTQAAGALGSHFSCFRERYLAGKTVHKGSVTATEAESV